MRRLLGVTVAMVLAVMVGGCAGDAFPTGKWAGTVSGIAYVLEFRSDGTWTITWRDQDNKEQTNEGTYTTDKDTITFVTDAICDGQGHEDDGTYTWRHANDELLLNRQKDECPDRMATLSGRILTPAK
jgi:hypothetical protein